MEVEAQPWWESEEKKIPHCAKVELFGTTKHCQRQSGLRIRDGHAKIADAGNANIRAEENIGAWPSLLRMLLVQQT